jgi:hypothetical protein
MHHPGIANAGKLNGCLNRLLDLLGGHAGAQLPCQDISRIIIENSAQIVPAPVNNLKPGKVRLPQLIRCSGWIGELVLSRYNCVYRAGYQIMGLQYSVYT